MKTIIKNITILRPGGNDTALVPGINRTQQEKKVINDAIMKKYKNVEQVGFIDISKPELQMAGGEFCGNATRSTAFLVLKGKTGEIIIKTSGVNQKLRVGIDILGNTWCQMPIYKNPDIIKKIGKFTVVPLYGITQVIVEVTKKFTNQQLAKTKALSYLKKLNLLKPVPASGVMFLYKENEMYSIEPVVWVRDVKTLFYETACGSGTTAVGLYLSQQREKNINQIPIFQPSGQSILVTIERNKKKFMFAKISGPIQILNKKIQIKMEVECQK